MNSQQVKLTARLKKVGPQFVEFELVIIDSTVCGELIMYREAFWNFVKEQGVKIMAETEEERIMLLELMP
jgi:hypothetical protein